MQKWKRQKFIQICFIDIVRSFVVHPGSKHATFDFTNSFNNPRYHISYLRWIFSGVCFQQQWNRCFKIAFNSSRGGKFSFKNSAIKKKLFRAPIAPDVLRLSKMATFKPDVFDKILILEVCKFFESLKILLLIFQSLLEYHKAFLWRKIMLLPRMGLLRHSKKSFCCNACRRWH